MLTSVRDAPPQEAIRACTMVGSWQAIGAHGYVSMRVLDMAGANISAASATVTAGISVHRAVRSVVNKIYSQLNYTGFNERTLNDVLSRNYPKRPTVDVTEDAIKNS